MALRVTRTGGRKSGRGVNFFNLCDDRKGFSGSKQVAGLLGIPQGHASVTSSFSAPLWL